MKAHHPEKGSALWFILLAIALLTALTITVTRVSDTVDQSGDIERLRVHASSIMRFAGGVEQAVEQMRLHGLSENEISFENDVVAGYANARCGSNACKIFYVGGGGLTYKIPSADITSSGWLFSGANNIAGVGTDGTGPTSSSDNELTIILPGISRALCERINAELGIAGVPQDTGQADVNSKYTGTFPNGETIEAPAGSKTGCFEGNQDENAADISGTYYFFHTLITR